MADGIQVGRVEALIVADGDAAYDPASLLPDLSAEERTALLGDRPAASGSLPVPYAPVLVRTPDGLVLVDAGAGEELAAEWEDPIGRTEASLAAVGVRPTDIRTVVLTHAHADHVGGLTLPDANGARVPRYVNARHVLSRIEWEFWVEREHEIPFRRWLAGLARRHLVPLRDAGLLELVDGEVEVSPGVTVVPAPGHTPGHVAVAFESDAAEFLALGDAVIGRWSFEHPEWRPTTEVDAALATVTARRLLERAALRGSVVHAYHLGAIGTVVRDREGYAFVDAGR